MELVVAGTKGSRGGSYVYTPVISALTVVSSKKNDLYQETHIGKEKCEAGDIMRGTKGSLRTNNVIKYIGI